MTDFHSSGDYASLEVALLRDDIVVHLSQLRAEIAAVRQVAEVALAVARGDYKSAWDAKQRAMVLETAAKYETGL